MPELSLGIGLTNKCNLNCPHCYSRGEKEHFIKFSDIIKLEKNLNIQSINLGTGESFLHPQYEQIIKFIHSKGIKLSLTTNGYTVEKMSDEQLRYFNDIDFSLDFPDEREHNTFRNGNVAFSVLKGIERCKKLGVECSIATALMNINYNVIDKICALAQSFEINLRINIYKSVHTDKFKLTYDQFWEGIVRLFQSSKLISCSEPIINAILKNKVIDGGSPCGKRSLRIRPNGCVSSCVYLHNTQTTIDDLIQASSQQKDELFDFEHLHVIPEKCRECKYVEYCQGGCIARRIYCGDIMREDEYCFVNKGKIPKIDVQWADKKDLVHSDYLCTIIVQ